MSVRDNLVQGFTDIAMESYDQGVADERKRCFDIIKDRVELFLKLNKTPMSDEWRHQTSGQLMEAMIIAERIDQKTTGEIWKNRKHEFYAYKCPDCGSHNTDFHSDEMTLSCNGCEKTFKVTS